MKPAFPLIAVALLCHLPVELHSQGLFSRLRGNTAPERVLSSEEMASRENQALASFEKAQGYEQSGRLRAARDLYREIAKLYPNTRIGAEAQFRLAQVREREGDQTKAYEEYRTLINTYRQSPHFQTAIERQFVIAQDLKNSDKRGFFGIGAPVQPSDLKEMFEEIAEAAPYSEYAPRSLMAIGELNVRDNLRQDAIRSYQAVVDNYRNTSFASDAQYEIYKLRGVAAAQSNSPSQDRAQVDAGLDFVAQNPNDTRAEEVKEGLEKIEARTLEKMFKTGQFYEEKEQYDSAAVYYREILKKPNSVHYAEAARRMEKIRRIQAGEEIEERANRFGALPALPKIERPRFLIGGDDDVEPLPASDAPESGDLPAEEPVPLPE